MAAVFTNALASGIGTVETTVYTATVKAILVGCNAANVAEATLPITVAVKRGVSRTHIVKDKRVIAGDSHEVMKGNKIVLLPGDSVVSFAGDSSAFDVVLSLLEGVA